MGHQTSSICAEVSSGKKHGQQHMKPLMQQVLRGSFIEGISSFVILYLWIADDQKAFALILFKFCDIFALFVLNF